MWLPRKTRSKYLPFLGLAVVHNGLEKFCLFGGFSFGYLINSADRCDSTAKKTEGCMLQLYNLQRENENAIEGTWSRNRIKLAIVGRGLSSFPTSSCGKSYLQPKCCFWAPLWSRDTAFVAVMERPKLGSECFTRSQTLDQVSTSPFLPSKTSFSFPLQRKLGGSHTL